MWFTGRKVSELAKEALTSNVKRHKIVAAAYSPSFHYITSTVNAKGSGKVSRHSLHAEERLLNRLAKSGMFMKYPHVHILVIRYSPMWGYRLARPCRKCMGLIRRCQVASVYYSTGDVYTPFRSTSWNTENTD